MIAPATLKVWFCSACGNRRLSKGGCCGFCHAPQDQIRPVTYVCASLDGGLRTAQGTSVRGPSRTPEISEKPCKHGGLVVWGDW